MHKRLMAAFLFVYPSVGCGERVKSGEGYELSDVENEGESLNTDAGGIDESDDDEDTGDEAGGESEGGSDENPVDRRTFAQKLVVSMLMPGVFAPGDLQETLTISYFRVDWVRDGTDVTWTEELCHIRATEAHNTKTEFPAPFVATMPIRENYGTLSAEEVGADFTVDTFINIDGAELDSPASEALPTSTGDSRLRDQDADGKPGVTIHIDAPFGVSGDVYLAQRSRYSFDGRVIDHDRIEAYVEYRQDQSIVDASSAMLTIADITLTPNPDRTTSYVLFQQVEDDITCSDIKRENDDLFED